VARAFFGGSAQLHFTPQTPPLQAAQQALSHIFHTPDHRLPAHTRHAPADLLAGMDVAMQQTTAAEAHQEIDLDALLNGSHDEQPEAPTAPRPPVQICQPPKNTSLPAIALHPAKTTSGQNALVSVKLKISRMWQG